MRGWRYESNRHALAAKGIRTGYFMPFVKRAGVPLIDHPEQFAGENFAYNKRVVKMKPSEFLRLANTDTWGSVPPDQSLDAWKNERWYSQSKVDRIRKGMDEGKNIPAPYLEMSPDYVEHEGRHRAIYAWEEGQDIPVIRVIRVHTKPNREKRDVGTTEDLIPGEFEGGKTPEEEQWYAKKHILDQINYEGKLVPEKITVYHGTGATEAEMIEKEGLKTGEELGKPGGHPVSYGSIDAAHAYQLYAESRHGNVEPKVIMVHVPKDQVVLKPFPSSHDENIGISGTAKNVRVLQKAEMLAKVHKHEQKFGRIEEERVDQAKVDLGLAKIHFRRMFPAKKVHSESPVSSEELKRWHKNVNMTPTEIELFMKRYGKTAGLSRQEASKEGIKSGRDSARAIIRMKRKPVANWNDGDIKWMRRQNSFVVRMRGAQGPLYDDKGRPTRKLLALKVWGHNPEK